MRWNGVDASSGTGTVNGSRPSNQGFTVCLSVERTSTGFALASSVTCMSTSSGSADVDVVRIAKMAITASTTAAAAAHQIGGAIFFVTIDRRTRSLNSAD